MLRAAGDSRTIGAQASVAVEFRGNHTAFEREGYGRRHWLGGCTAPTPQAALEWIRRRVWETAVQLDGPAEKIAWAWLSDPRAQDAALLRLMEARPVTFLLSDDQARYEVFVQGLPIADVSRTDHPHPRAACQDRRRRHARVRKKSGARRFARSLDLPSLLVAGASAVLRTPHRPPAR